MVPSFKSISKLNTRLPPIPGKRVTQVHSPSMSSNFGDEGQAEDKSSPKVAPRRHGEFTILIDL
ncbi:unnamed protein product [Rodentolepis nana]|uniref:Uncharacterized protein n=1 Tax=Rodentolepis nana TaxID=102285 RepID=A0A0R3T257_RODNA|nr:unnamed protein product [Rodentolepis nana]